MRISASAHQAWNGSAFRFLAAETPKKGVVCGSAWMLFDHWAARMLVNYWNAYCMLGICPNIKSPASILIS